MKTTDKSPPAAENPLSPLPEGFKLFAREELAKELDLLTKELNPLHSSFTINPDKIYVNAAQGITISSETLTDALLKKILNQTSLLSSSLAQLYLQPENINKGNRIEGMNLTEVKSIIGRLSTTLIDTYRQQANAFWESEEISVPQELQAHLTSELLKSLAESISLVEKAYQIDAMYPNLKQVLVVYFSQKLQSLYEEAIHPDAVRVHFFHKGQENSHPPFLSFSLTEFVLHHFSPWFISKCSPDKVNIQVKAGQNAQSVNLDRLFQESDITAIKSSYQEKFTLYWHRNHTPYRDLAKFSFLKALFEQQNSTLALSKKGFELACQAASGFNQQEIHILEGNSHGISVNTLKALTLPRYFKAPHSIPNEIEVSCFCINNQIATDMIKICDPPFNDCVLYIPGYTPPFIEAKNEWVLIDWVFAQAKSSQNNLTSIASHFPLSSRIINAFKLDAFLYPDYTSEGSIVLETNPTDIFYFITERQFKRVLADLNADKLPAPFYISPDYQSTDSAFFKTIAPTIEYIPHLLPNIHATSHSLLTLLPHPHTTASEFMKTAIQEKLHIDLDPDTTFIGYFYPADKPIAFEPGETLESRKVSRKKTQTLTEAALSNYRMGFTPFSSTTIVFTDPSARGLDYPSRDHILKILPKDIEEIIQSVDLNTLHKSKLSDFWKAHTDRVKHFVKHRYLQQVLEAHQNKILSEESFKVVVNVTFCALALEEGESPSFINPNIRTEILSIAGYQTTDIFTFRDTSQKGVILYIAGNTEAFFAFTNQTEFLCFLRERTGDTRWQELLASHVSLDVREEVLHKLQEDSHIPTLPVTYSPTSELVGCASEKPFNQSFITTTPITESFFEVMQKNIHERSYIDANVLITSDKELLLERLIHVTKFIKNALLVPSIAFPVLNWITLTALATETALNIYLAKNSDTVQERYQAAKDIGINAAEWLLIGGFLSFRALKLSKPRFVGGSGLYADLKKSPISEEVFFGTTKSMQAWSVQTSTPRFPLDVKAWFLDDQFLLFTGKTNKADHLIISSHGGYLPGSGIVPVPENTELAVLGPHGWELIDPTTANIAKKTVLAYGIISKKAILPTQSAFSPNLYPNVPPNTHVYPKPTDIKVLAGTKTLGHIRNYSLVKYQKFKPGKESYTDIIHIVNRSRNTLPTIDNLGVKPVDILTIRNRYGRISNPSIQKLFQALQSQEIHYKRITLAFCRSNMLLSAIDLAPSYIPPALQVLKT